MHPACDAEDYAARDDDYNNSYWNGRITDLENYILKLRRLLRIQKECIDLIDDSLLPPVTHSSRGESLHDAFNEINEQIDRLKRHELEIVAKAKKERERQLEEARRNAEFAVKKYEELKAAND